MKSTPSFANRSTDIGSATLMVCLTIFTFVGLFLIGSFNRETAVVAVAAAGIFEMGRRIKISELRTRLNQQRDVKWTVFVNKVAIGELADEHVTKISLDALLHAGNYVGQAAEVAKVLLRVSLVLFIAIPCLLVWMVAGTALIAPSELAFVIHSASVSDIPTMSSTIGMLLVKTIGLAAGLWFLLGGPTGFNDAFAADRSRRARLLTRTSAVGELTLVSDNAVL